MSKNEELLQVIDELDKLYQFIKSLRDKFTVKQNEFDKYDYKLDGIRESIYVVENMLERNLEK